MLSNICRILWQKRKKHFIAEEADNADNESQNLKNDFMQLSNQLVKSLS